MRSLSHVQHMCISHNPYHAAMGCTTLSKQATKQSPFQCNLTPVSCNDSLNFSLIVTWLDKFCVKFPLFLQAHIHNILIDTVIVFKEVSSILLAFLFIPKLRDS